MANFHFVFLLELSINLRSMIKYLKECFILYPNTLNSVEKIHLLVVFFSTHFSVSWYWMKHSFPCLIYYSNFNSWRIENVLFRCTKLNMASLISHENSLFACFSTLSFFCSVLKFNIFSIVHSRTWLNIWSKNLRFFQISVSILWISLTECFLHPK